MLGDFNKQKIFVEGEKLCFREESKKFLNLLLSFMNYYYFNNSITQRIFSEEDNDFIKNSYTASNEEDLKNGQVMAFLGFEGTLFYILR